MFAPSHLSYFFILFYCFVNYGMNSSTVYFYFQFYLVSINLPQNRTPTTRVLFFILLFYHFHQLHSTINSHLSKNIVDMLLHRGNADKQFFTYLNIGVPLQH